MRRPVTTAERLAVRASNVPKEARSILEHDNGSTLYTYERAGKLLAMAFWGTSSRPLWHFSFRTEEQRNAKIAEFKASVEHRVEFRTAAKAARVETVTTMKCGLPLATWVEENHDHTDPIQVQS